jgi:glycine C-acetyltransferase
MPREEAIRDGDLEGDEEAEAEAEQAGCDSQPAVERGKALARVSEWRADRHGDEHHAGDGAHAKDQQIRDGPARVANFRQHQQGNRGRSGKPVHQANGQRPKKLIKPKPPQHPLKSAPWRLVRLNRVQVHVDLRAVAVNVLVNDAVMLVTMRVHHAALLVVRRIAVGDALRHPGQVQNAEQNQHQPDGQLHREADARWNDNVEQNNRGADTEDGDGVANPPQHANHARLPDAPLPADDRGNGNHMVGVRGMAHAEDKSQTDNCQQIHHAALSPACPIPRVRPAWPALVQQRQTLSSYASAGKIDASRECENFQPEVSAAMYGTMQKHLQQRLAEIENAGLYKRERVLAGPQQPLVSVADGASSSKPVLNLCANNYLGLANHPDVIEVAQQALCDWGYGLASVRFICGTQSIHKQLEDRLSSFLGMDDTILYSSCFDANGGLFETLMEADDAIISDELNHASIIDGVRLSKAARFRYRNGDMQDLEAKLKEAGGARHRLIATDGIFSMDGYLARLDRICELAEKYDALVMVDDSHAVGFIGEHGRGTPEACGVEGRIDILTGTLGKALGGASGGYTSGRQEIIDLLRQRSRPYLFSNSVAPPIVAASLKVLDLVAQSSDLRVRLEENTRYFRAQMTQAGFNVLPGEHPIVPVMFGEAVVATRMAELLLGKGVYVVAFSYPVVPQGKARIRTQISAAHTRKEIEFAIEKFTEAKRELNL